MRHRPGLSGTGQEQPLIDDASPPCEARALSSRLVGGNMRKLWSVLPLSLIACAALAANAQAGVVTVGPQLTTGTFTTSGEEAIPYLVTNTALAEPGAQTVSPVTGVIVGWHLRAAEGIGFELYTLKPGRETTYTVTGASGGRSPATTGLESFPASLPINAGEAIGLMVPPDDKTGFGGPGSQVVFWEPALAVGATAAGTEVPSDAYAFNAEVQPAPTIGSLGTASGPTGGGTTVAIGGTDFAGVSAVKFGSTAASSYTVDSEGQITAISPAGSAGSVTVSVSTIAGTATSSQQFAYQAPPTSAPAPVPPTPTCTVPKLKGKSLKASKAKIKGANCKVGKITKKKGAKAATGKVVGQSKKPGTVLPEGSVVKVTLGKG
jgi:hypothetical protein